MEFIPSGVCSRAIHVELDGDTIKNVEFVGGCNGNTQGIASLVRGMKVDDAISRMEGITCGYKSTSCPDQLATALKKAAGY
ncbi:MAG: TIGR03905 family TSCPD domain-containing protein [Schaedlerella sp.]|uniref:TIGR03905 family TSCPD domain-containing protein n=1 Tax=Schaedlerella sp. TaxID=2676057 RepID=UPI00352985B3